MQVSALCGQHAMWSRFQFLFLFVFCFCFLFDFIVCVLVFGLWCITGSDIGVVVQDKETLMFILQSDNLQVISFAFEEANHGKARFGEDIDGGDLVSIQSKMSGFLHNCIFQEEEGLKSSKASTTNQFRLHVAKEHCGTFLLETEEESLFVWKDSRILGHPLHPIFVLLLEMFCNRPGRNKSCTFQCFEEASFGSLDLKSSCPEVFVEVFLVVFAEELLFIVGIQKGDDFVLEHEGCEEETSFVVLVNGSVPFCVFIDWTEASCI